jgi:phosphohistidine phosphatase SixA
MRRQVGVAMLMMALTGLSGCPSPSTPRRPPSAALPATNAAELSAALRQGGLVVFLRHAASTNGETHVVLDDCTTQDGLTAGGRAQAEAIATAVRRQRIPIGAVRSSPYCRSADTARLAFGHLLLDDDLLPLRGSHAGEQVAAVRRLLGTPPLPGRNTILVGHADIIDKLTGIELTEGEALVVRPAAGGGSFSLLGRLRAEQW